MSFGYTLDNTATNFVLSAQSISNSTLVPGLAFSFPTNCAPIGFSRRWMAPRPAIKSTSPPTTCRWPALAAGRRLVVDLGD